LSSSGGDSMRAVLSDAKVLKLSMDAISNMIDEANIEASEAGLRLRAMDPAHVALVDFLLPAGSFDEYECGSEMVLGVDLDRLNTILKRAGSADSVELRADGEKLDIVLHGRAKRRFSLPLIEVGDEELRVPELSFLAAVEIEPKLLSEAIKDVEIASEHVTFACDQQSFRISGSGDLGSVEVEISREEAISFSCEAPARSMFSIDYLRDMTRAGDLAESARLSIGNDIPLKLEYLGSASLSFLLAPRIESE